MQLAEFRDRQVIEPKGINLGGTGCGMRIGVDLEIDIPGEGDWRVPAEYADDKGVRGGTFH